MTIARRRTVELDFVPRGDKLVIERVELLRPVEREQRDWPAMFDEQRIRHVGLLTLDAAFYVDPWGFRRDHNSIIVVEDRPAPSHQLLGGQARLCWCPYFSRLD